MDDEQIKVELRNYLMDVDEAKAIPVFVKESDDVYIKGIIFRRSQLPRKRRLIVVALRDSGHTFKSIGSKIGMSRSRCSEIYKDHVIAAKRESLKATKQLKAAMSHSLKMLVSSTDT